MVVPESRVVEQVRVWRDDLLSLTRNSNLLYFRHLKVGSVEVTGRGPAALYSGLTQPRSTGWVFQAVARDGEEEEAGSVSEVLTVADRSGDDTVGSGAGAPGAVWTSKSSARELAASLRTLHRSSTQESSVGYGPDGAGKFTLNLGPLNKPGGERRLNVAITRARQRVEIVTSVSAADFVGTSTSEGVRHLRRFLDFAERGTPALNLEIGPDGRDTESPFEEEVARQLRSWGYDVVPQVGQGSYRIDLAVRDSRAPGGYLLGVECDGFAYHSSKAARDRDRLRHEQLVAQGWTIHHIWSTAWYHGRGHALDALREAVNSAQHRSGSAAAPTADTPASYVTVSHTPSPSSHTPG